MRYAVVTFPDVPTRGIESVRRRFDPQHGRVAPHITLVFPTSLTVASEQLFGHLRQVAAHHEPFPIRLHGLRRESTHWLVLDVAEGATQIRDLHDALYTGPLAASLRQDIPYLPHVTLGVFGRAATQTTPSSAETRWQEAWTAATELSLDFACMVRWVSLLTIAETQDITIAGEFELA